MSRSELCRRTWLSLSLLWGLGACREGERDAQDASKVARDNAAQRLQGRWLLLNFRPKVVLEPMLDAMLRAQFNALVTTFQGDRLYAQGPGVNTVRRFVVVEAYEERLAVDTVDDRGVAYRAVGAFRGSELWFESRTSPWQGSGVLRRLP